MRYRSSSSSLASTSAAMVLPVPLAPANSALMPSPRRSCAAKPHRVVDLGALPDVDGDLAQQRRSGFRQHQVVPGRGGLDALRQLLQPLRGGVLARLPE